VRARHELRDVDDLGGSHVDVIIPNTAPCPKQMPTNPRHRGPDATFVLLFVGSLNYSPNHDAVEFLCREILPAIRRSTAQPFRLDVVGAMPPGLRDVCASAGPDVRVIGRVADVTPYYAEADAVMVTLRAGGGTRIKMIEAMAFGRPCTAPR
jgi:polysaccharide biosynthesis protein PslH